MKERTTQKPVILASDLEGVLLPEIWINFAEATKIEKLRLTTRDITDYDELMSLRLKILDENGLKLQDIQNVIDTMNPLEGAVNFTQWARESLQLIILSDTFYEFAAPLIKKLGNPTLFCHNILTDDTGRVSSYRLRTEDGKKKAVRCFQEMGFYVVSVGDSYNDVSMLGQADQGILFNAPDNVIKDYPQYPVYNSYTDLKDHLLRLS